MSIIISYSEAAAALSSYAEKIEKLAYDGLHSDLLINNSHIFKDVDGEIGNAIDALLSAVNELRTAQRVMIAVEKKQEESE